MQHSFADSSRFTELLAANTDPEEILSKELGEVFRQYRSDWRKACDLQLVTDFPLHIGFELNHSCNMECPMCPWSVKENKNVGKKSWFSLDDFRRIIEQGVALGLRSVALNWINEPLIRPDLPDFAKVARELGIKDVFIHTNALLMDETTAGRLIDSGVTRIMCSLDAFSKTVYDQIRIGGDLDKVRQNILKLVEVRNSKGLSLPVVSVNFVRMKMNDQELEQFMEYWAPKVDFLAIQELINPFDDEIVESHLERDKESFPDFKCAQPFQRLTISYKGDVMPCCTNFAPGLKLGSIHTDSLEDLWHGEKMSQLREQHRSGNYHENPVCRKCVRNLVCEKT